MSTAAPAIPGYCVDADCACHQPGYEWLDTHVFGREGLPDYCCTRCGRRGPRPATIVPPSEVISFEALAERIRATHQQYSALLNEYHRVWYESGHTWVYCHFAGVGVMKNPNDLWAYQELIASQRPRTIIETGTYSGGSALWFASILDFMGIDGRILTIDLDDHRRCAHPKITFIGGDSTDPNLAAAVLAEVEHPLMVILDSDHAAVHVRRELDLYAPAVRVGEYLIVEDTNIGWDGPGGFGERGARGGVEDYLTAHPGEFMQDIIPERFLLTMAPGGYLKRIAECPHA